ncbi:MAG TPA: SRPBCC family protein [Solirubrobacteraceae bacterium]|jgi:ribosome-associated toxin RatA of RatAB toxin-antitoxin module
MSDLDGTRSIEISAAPGRCFAIAADIEQAPQWHGSMTHVEVVERDGDGRATVVESELDASVTRVRMHLRFSYDEPTGVRWTRESGDLRTLEGSWHFQERGDGLTVATYTLEIGVGRRLALLVRTVRGPVRDRVESLLVDRPVEGLKARAESSG